MPDALLSEMSRAAREHALADPRWAAFAAGTLAGAEREDLLRKAREAGIDEETIAAFGPREEAFDDRLAEAALAAMRKRPAAKDGSSAGEEAGSGQPAGTKEIRPAETRSAGAREAEGGRVLPFRRRAAALVGTAAVLAAAAAAFLLLPRAPEMPEYTLSVEGGQKAQRSSPDDPGGVIELVPGNRVVLTMRPEAPAPVKVAGRAYVLGPAPVAERQVRVDVAESGAVRIAAPAEELLAGVPSGAWDLCVAVGEPSRLPPATVTKRPPARGDGFVAACRRVVWTAP